ncbi:MAG: DUF2393 domain-containing protein, partial [Verrucomicrobiaceae bacterium]|nr:DUF2393 domain-containing protein [Verrucomicrobiaceae bacterium]
FGQESKSTLNQSTLTMIAKMKCSNCGAEMSNLNMSWGKKQLWIILPIMLLGFLPMVKLFWFKGEATRDLVISDVQKRTVGDTLEIVGLVTNKGKHKFSSVTIEVEFFDPAGVFIDEQNEYMRSHIVGGAKEHFKISVKSPPAQVNSADSKMVVKVASGMSMPF